MSAKVKAMMDDEAEWWEFEDAAQMAVQAASDIAFVIESAIAAHGNARIGVPSGIVCDRVYGALAARKDIDWTRLTLVPTDDRLVPADHDFSTFGKLNRFFGSTGATIIPLVDEAVLDDVRKAGQLADARLAALEWPLDLVWLGVGADGHVMGMFPGPDLAHALSGPRERRAIGLHPDPMPANTPFDRVTMTAAAIVSARTVMIVTEGQERRDVLETALGQGPLATTPVGRLLSQIEAPLDIFWSA